MKSKRINIRVTQAEYDAIVQKAEALGISVSKLLVMAALSAQGLNFGEKKDFVSRLHQLRLKVCSASGLADVTLLRQEVAELCQLLSSLTESAGEFSS